MTGRGAIACACALVLSASVARGDAAMNGWDAARDPIGADRSALHLRVTELRASARIAPRDLYRARVLLETAGAEKSPDVRLRFDLGEVYAELEDNARAIEVLSAALALAPDHPGALQAYAVLANAYAKLDRSVDERRVYDAYLRRVIDDRARATALLNLAEADMHLGELDSAVAGYRSALELANQLPNVVQLQDPTGVLAVWGLAVALDRSGDIAGGGKEARLAVELDGDMRLIRMEGGTVFFSPERERYWYVALGFIEYARQASDPRASATYWSRAEGCWREYLDDVRAHAAADRWVTVARARYESARAQRFAAERRAKTPLVYPQYECVR